MFRNGFRMRRTIRHLLRSRSAFAASTLLLLMVASLVPVAARASAVSSSSFYPVSAADYATWTQSGGGVPPQLASSFSAGVPAVAFYFTYHHAVPGRTTYRITVYDGYAPVSKRPGGKGTVYAAGPFTATSMDAARMEAVPGANAGRFTEGYYLAVLHVDGAPDLSVRFMVGAPYAVAGMRFMTPASWEAYQAALVAGQHPRVPRQYYFPAPLSTLAVTYYYLYAHPATDVVEIRVLNQQGAPVAHTTVPVVKASSGLTELTLTKALPSGTYQGQILVNGAVHNSVTITIGPLARASTCAARDYVATCIEPSILRLVVSPNAVNRKGTTGTGFVIRADMSGTYVLTSKHLVDGITAAGISAFTTALDSSLSIDQRSYSPVLAIARNGAAVRTIGDLAVLRLPPSDLHPLRFGDSDRLKMQQPVISIGYLNGDFGAPLVTLGAITGLHRDFSDGEGPVWIQHDASVNHGYGGGPLLDSSFRVVGVNLLVLLPDLGLYLASPSNGVKEIAGTLADSLALGSGGTK